MLQIANSWQGRMVLLKYRMINAFLGLGRGRYFCVMIGHIRLGGKQQNGKPEITNAYRAADLRRG